MFIGDITYVDKDFRADLGFVRRTDIFKAGQAVKGFLSLQRDFQYPRIDDGGGQLLKAYFGLQKDGSFLPPQFRNSFEKPGHSLCPF